MEATSRCRQGGSTGLVVMGGDSFSKGREFESQHHILNGHLLKSTKINEKRDLDNVGFRVIFQPNSLEKFVQDRSVFTRYLYRNKVWVLYLDSVFYFKDSWLHNNI